MIILNTILFVISYSSGLSFTDIKVIAAILLSVILCVFIGFFLTRKYISDIRNNVKTKEIKVISSKESKKDYEAGSATLCVTQEMNEFIRFDVIVENCRYRVEKEFFENCNVGDEVYFNIAPKSKYLLSIELKNLPK